MGHAVSGPLSNRYVRTAASAAILPANPALYAVLRQAHTLLAYLLFMTFLAHLGAVLFHTLILRDRLLNRMALWSIRSRESKSQS